MPKIEISDRALAYLKGHAEPLSDTTVTVLDRLLSEHHSLTAKPDCTGSALEMRFNGTTLPSVKHTAILSAKVENKPATKKSWNHVLEDVIAACAGKGIESAEIRHVLQAKTLDGQHDENGYRFVPSAGFSFQGLEANRVCRNLAALCKQFGIAVDIEFRWLDEDKASFPGQVARIVLP